MKENKDSIGHIKIFLYIEKYQNQKSKDKR